jgi:competence protein ComEA
MRERPRSDRRHTLELAPAGRAGGLGPPRSAARAFGGARMANSARFRVWAPIAGRALALGIALLGLAGIGSVVARAPAPPLPPPPAPGVSHAELGFGALSGRALAVLASAGSPPSGAAAASPESVSVEADAGPAPPCPERGAAPAGREPAGRAPTQPPVVLNTADASELQRLPGVGAKRAEAILALRQRLGRFRRPSDLLRVKGIGPRTLERMLPHLTLD